MDQAISEFIGTEVPRKLFFNILGKFDLRTESDLTKRVEAEVERIIEKVRSLEGDVSVAVSEAHRTIICPKDGSHVAKIAFQIVFPTVIHPDLATTKEYVNTHFPANKWAYIERNIYRETLFYALNQSSPKIGDSAPRKPVMKYSSPGLTNLDWLITYTGENSNAGLWTAPVKKKRPSRPRNRMISGLKFARVDVAMDSRSH